MARLFKSYNPMNISKICGKNFPKLFALKTCAEQIIGIISHHRFKKEGVLIHFNKL